MKAGDKQAPEGGAPPAAGAQTPTAEGNTLQRAATVIQRLKVPATVAAGVLAEHGLTRTALVDPADFEAKVTQWLGAPAGGK